MIGKWQSAHQTGHTRSLSHSSFITFTDFLGRFDKVKAAWARTMVQRTDSRWPERQMSEYREKAKHVYRKYMKIRLYAWYMPEKNKQKSQNWIKMVRTEVMYSNIFPILQGKKLTFPIFQPLQRPLTGVSDSSLKLHLDRKWKQMKVPPLPLRIVFSSLAAQCLLHSHTIAFTGAVQQWGSAPINKGVNMSFHSFFV